MPIFPFGRSRPEAVGLEQRRGRCRRAAGTAARTSRGSARATRDVVGRDAEQPRAGRLDVAPAVAQRAGLARAARRVVLGIEVEDDRASAQVGEAHGRALSSASEKSGAGSPAVAVMPGILAHTCRRARRPPGPGRLRRRDQPDRRHLGPADLARAADGQPGLRAGAGAVAHGHLRAGARSGCCSSPASTARRCSCTTSTVSRPPPRCCSPTRPAPRTRAATSLVFAVIAVVAGLLAGRAFMTGKGYG